MRVGRQRPEKRRDAQFNGPIMSVDQFPTSKFVLASAVALPGADANGCQ